MGRYVPATATPVVTTPVGGTWTALSICGVGSGPVSFGISGPNLQLVIQDASAGPPPAFFSVSIPDSLTPAPPYAPTPGRAVKRWDTQSFGIGPACRRFTLGVGQEAWVCLRQPTPNGPSTDVGSAGVTVDNS